MKAKKQRNALARYLFDHGISQKAFADRIPTDYAAMSRWVNGLSRPSVENMLRIQKLTGISIEEMMKWGR